MDGRQVDYEKLKVGDGVFVKEYRWPGTAIFARDVIVRLTPKMVVLQDGSRYYRASGERVGGAFDEKYWGIYPITAENTAVYEQWLDDTERVELARKIGEVGFSDWEQLSLEQLRGINTMLAEATADR